MKLVSQIAIVGVIFSGIVGCGGGTVSADSISPQLTISWPSIGKAFGAPAYAGSAIISIQPEQGTLGTDWTVKRPSGSDAVAMTYTGPAVSNKAPMHLNIAFKYGPNGDGPTVAEARLDVTVTSKGKLLNDAGADIGDISYLTDISYIQVSATDCSVGTSQTLTVTGTCDSQVIALPQELAKFSIKSGSDCATLNGNVLTATKPGTVTLQIGYDTKLTNKTIQITP